MIQISSLSWHTKSVQLLSDPIDELIARAYEKVSLFIYYLHYLKAIQRVTHLFIFKSYIFTKFIEIVINVYSYILM